MMGNDYNFLCILYKEYTSFRDNIKHYVQLFGCLCHVILSPYFHISVILGLISTLNTETPGAWATISLSILPCLLGFSIGGYAILMSFGDEKFKKFIATFRPKGEDNSLLMIVNGTFLHFILIQVVATIVAVIIYLTKITNIYANIFGCILFYYALVFCAAAAFEIKTVGHWYKMFADKENEKKSRTNKPDPDCRCENCRKKTH